MNKSIGFTIFSKKQITMKILEKLRFALMVTMMLGLTIGFTACGGEGDHDEDVHEEHQDGEHPNDGGEHPSDEGGEHPSDGGSEHPTE